MLNESSATTIAWNVNAVSTYSIYLSSAPLKESVTVVYDIIAGDGLTEGVDYEIVNKSNSVVFLPGIYDMPIYCSQKRDEMVTRNWREWLAGRFLWLRQARDDAYVRRYTFGFQ